MEVNEVCWWVGVCGRLEVGKCKREVGGGGGVMCRMRGGVCERVRMSASDARG